MSNSKGKETSTALPKSAYISSRKAKYKIIKLKKTDQVKKLLSEALALLNT